VIEFLARRYVSFNSGRSSAYRISSDDQEHRPRETSRGQSLRHDQPRTN